MLFASPAPVLAHYVVPVPGGLFEFDILEKGESIPPSVDVAADATATHSLTDVEVERLVDAAEYWTTVLGPGIAGSRPASVMVLGISGYRAETISPVLGDTGQTRLNAYIVSGIDQDAPLFLIRIGDSNLDYSEDVRPLLSNKDAAPLVAAAVHEIGHALGVAGRVQSDTTTQEYRFYPFPIDDKAHTFNGHLYDALGTRVTPGAVIELTPTLPEKGEEGVIHLQGNLEGYYGFTANSGLHFRGEHVDEVLEGALIEMAEDSFSLVEEACSYKGAVPGVPVNGFEYYVPDMSHLELQNGLMSHQSWRNWGVFMEAELAVLQDLGYSFDRKRFFGRSIYISGEEGALNQVVNDRPYYERANGQWLEGLPSTTPWGIGLHVYGSWNDVRQVADILTVGTFGTGVRLEGVCNRLTVESGVAVRADGREGTGLLVSYGRNHTVNVRGLVTALGEGGVAARFDFGGNILGDAYMYRGSYMLADKVPGYTYDSSQLTKIYGPLVDAFNVSGTLLGSDAAVFIAENAYVKEINILSGATLAGDIVSDWDPDNSKLSPPEEFVKPGGGTTLRTKLTFGLAPTEEGEAGDPDEGFFLAYDGNILGAKSFDMRLEAGTLALGGSVDVHSLETASGATLALLAPRASAPQVRVKETFTLGDNATLATAFSGNGSVAGISAAHADLGSNLTWALVASPDWYANGILAVDPPLTTQDTSASSFSPSSVSLSSSSPTLTFQLAEGAGETGPDGQGGSGATVTVSRAKDAYARFASSSGDAEIGRALSAIAGEARGEMRTLLANMDWSGPDGAGVRAGLSRLSPEAYDAVARATLDEQSAFSRILLDRMLSDFASRQARNLMAEGNSAAGGARTSDASDTLRSPDADRWTVWAAPYGSGSFQNAHGSSSAWSSTGVGLVLGADRSFDSGLTLGGHVALAAKRVHIEDRAEGRADTKSAYAGLQAFFAPEEWSGFWLSAQGRLGIESGEMDREVRVGSYSRTAEGNWSGFAGSALLGGGKDFAAALGDGALVAGPLAWFEYAFLNRPSFGESGGGAANLDVDAALYESFLMNLGGHAAFRTVLDNGTTLGVDLLAAWRHELSYGRFATTAAFQGYGDHSFTSDSDLPGRDSLLARGGFTLANGQGFSVRLEAGVELFREDYTAVDVGLRFAWEF